jgi:hypothetical protein
MKVSMSLVLFVADKPGPIQKSKISGGSIQPAAVGNQLNRYPYGFFSDRLRLIAERPNLESSISG